MGPLAGYKIVEMAGIGPAPMCGDAAGRSRRRPCCASIAQQPSGLGVPSDARFQILNRSRHAIAVDLKKPEGVALVLRLVGSADALIEGFRPGVMERLGLGPDACLARNPQAGLRPHDRLGPGRAAGAGRRARPQLHRPRRRAARDRPRRRSRRRRR